MPDAPLFRRRRLLLGTLAALAFAVRVPGALEPPLEGRPLRQYRSALVARSHFVLSRTDAPPDRRAVAAEILRREGVLEPPIVEHAAALLYRATGREDPSLPRLALALLWVASGFAVAALGRRSGGPDGALVAAAFYWFVPFAVPASRAFQPDPLMVAALAAGLWAAVRTEERPDRSRAAVAFLLLAAAAFVKPVAALFAGGAVLGISVAGQGWRATVRRPRVWALVGLAPLPAAAWIAAQWMGEGRIGTQAATSFLPRLIAEPAFVRGWLRLVGETVGFPAVVGAALGCALAGRGIGRGLVVGMAAGYLLFGLAFPYHIQTHDYYHLPLVLLVAIALAPAGEGLAGALAKAAHGGRWAVALLAASVVLAIAVAGARADGPPAARLVAQARRLAAAIGHPTRTLILAPYNGKALQYHAELAGHPWPDASTLREDARRGGIPVAAAERLQNLLGQEKPSFFIVASRAELNGQPDLAAALGGRFPVVFEDDETLVFDLR